MVQSTNETRTILVTTAGKVGTEAARALAVRGRAVRLLVRHPERVRDLARLGVEIFSGDLEQADSVREAVHGVSAVILVTAPSVEQELSVIRSAERAGVEHVVKITSKASADSPIARRCHQSTIEEVLIASGLDYTLLRNNAYMQNFLLMAPSIVESNTFRSATGDGRIAHIDVADVAAVAAEIAASPGEHVGKTYWPTGPEALAGKDLAEILTKVLGRNIHLQPISDEEQNQAMLDAGLPANVARDNSRVIALMADGDCDYVTEDVQRILDRPARSFEQFAIAHAAVFASAEPTQRNENHDDH